MENIEVPKYITGSVNIETVSFPGNLGDSNLIKVVEFSNTSSIDPQLPYVVGVEIVKTDGLNTICNTMVNIEDSSSLDSYGGYSGENLAKYAADTLGFIKL